MVCWLAEERASAGICQKDYTSKNATLQFIHKGKEGGMRTGMTALFRLGRGSAAVCDVRHDKHRHLLEFASSACH